MVEHSFAVGETVIDRQDSPVIPSAIVALPAQTAGEWLLYGGVTVAGANPEYPADAPVVVVVATADVERYLPEWDGETSLSRSTLDEAGVYYTAVPAPRLIAAEADKQSNGDADALTNAVWPTAASASVWAVDPERGREPQEESPLSILSA